ncbi:MAG: hypothetical protein HC925_01515 [Coleofasciculaceae cyanobacterium SM2_3_26]|nr:hypothetical protein [Coleofasciculaceae cyanobacterium SM2_3_26]
MPCSSLLPPLPTSKPSPASPKPSNKPSIATTSTPSPKPIAPEPGINLRTAKADYTKLRDLLAAQKWKEADRETAERMLQVAGREKEGWLDSESIEQFPCEDLRTIDRLWVKYSNGHFGFSVQKKIWQQVGGKVDLETEKKLGDKLGWRVNGSWKNYDELTFTLTGETPLGHLPFCWGVLLLVAYSFVVFSRAKMCEL